MPSRVPREVRFAARVGVRRLDGCEPWLGQVSARTGGGLFLDDDNRQRSAQVVRWELAHGPLPPRTSATQRCGLPTCVGLEHLRLGRAASRAARSAPAPTTARPEARLDVLQVSHAARSRASALVAGAADVLLRSRRTLEAAQQVTQQASWRSDAPPRR